jgi:ElaB/YqjD/DUF883 family membrane-anchored ribosome-binding protein
MPATRPALLRADFALVRTEWSARQAIKHGRYATEDVIEEARHTVKQRPLEAMGIVFAAGLLAGGFLAWIGFHRR